MQNSATSHCTQRHAVSISDGALTERPSIVHRKVADSGTAPITPATSDGYSQHKKLSKLPENIWESPPQKAVRGVVQPRVFPPLGKPTRHTNQLQFMQKDVLDPLTRHQHAWPFISPVDAVKLNIPDYHSVVKRPMDLNTIGKRLQNSYYFSAEECMHDFETIFANCYEYNRKEDDVWLMCKNIENEYREKLRMLPTPEVELTRSIAKRLPVEDLVVRKRRRTRDDFAAREASSVGALCSPPLEDSVSLPIDAAGGSEVRYSL
uniref:Bromo domain-containing protein n=1 Tax=Parascaris univalens TaxID=6257 RepID=A0A915A1B2_PARUN